MNTFELITASQSGDEDATNKLLQIIKDQHMGRYTRRFIRRNVLVDQEEIESEFLVGCWAAIKKAKLDIGNPVNFICWKGSLKVLHLFRTKLRDGVRINCSTCGTGTLVYKAKLKRAVCGKCGATDVQTYMIVMDESQMNPEISGNAVVMPWDKIAQDNMQDEADHQFSNITYDIMVEEIRSRLNGRVLQLFDVMVVEAINRDTSDNYLSEIATRWGVSTACVSIYLRKLRSKVAEYMAEREAA